MDRTLVVTAQIAIAPGHRVEVTEHLDAATGQPVLLSMVDLDTGVRYRRAEAGDARSEVTRWRGRVLECTVAIGGHIPRTTLTIDPIGPGAAEASFALRDADAAADAAKAEADRWGGSDRPPAEEAPRFW